VSNQLNTSVSAAFDKASSGVTGIGLSIENDPGAYGDDVVHLLLFPNVAAQVACDIGTIEVGGTKVTNVQGGVLSFSGSAEASLGKIPNNVPTFNVLFAFDATNDSIGGLGSAGSDAIGFTWDGVANVLRASKPCYAAVSYTKYETTARQLRYRGKGEPLANGGIAVTFGVVAAYYNKSVVTHQVEPFNTDDGNSDYEMYRIVSSAITTRDGEFEKPPTFPTSGTYPDRALVLDTATFLETERVHEIGRMDAKGRAYVVTYYVPVLEPYIGDITYKPKKSLKESTLPSSLFTEEQILAAKAAVARRGQGKL
jgi:hypothetical protein